MNIISALQWIGIITILGFGAMYAVYKMKSDK